MKIVTVCTYKEGAPLQYLKSLKGMCEIHARGVHFLTISASEFSGWWAKMEAFKVLGPVLYMDLSNVVVDDLGDLLDCAEKYEFVVNRDPNRHQRNIQSCVMAWSGDMSYLYDLFIQAPEKHMNDYTTPRWWGDQGFIEYNAAGWKYWQDVAPGKVVSHKKDRWQGDAAIVNYHGKPKPWEI